MRNPHRVSMPQGLWGDVWFWSGDFMPVCEAGKVFSVARELRIHELTGQDDVTSEGGGFFTSVSTRLVATVASDSRGFFQLELLPGEYSVFVVEGHRLYANRGDGQGNIWPVRLEAGQVVGIRFDIDYAATY